jgi:hypothetical protein
MAAAFARKRGVADNYREREKQCYGRRTHGFMLHPPGRQRGNPVGYTGPLFRLLPHDSTASAYGPTPRRFRAMSRSVLNEVRQRLRICMLRDLAFAVH